jgi:hypothetical protein
VVHLVQTVHQSCVKISTISNELNQASTWASSPRSIIGCVQNDFWAYSMFRINRAPLLHWHQHYLKMDQNEIWHDPRHLGVPSGASKTISDVVVRLAQTVLLSCVKISTIFEWTESYNYLASSLALYQRNWIKHPLELRHLGVLSGVSKTISEPTICLGQTVHVSCNDTNTISKWTKMRFHMTHITFEFH